MILGSSLLNMALVVIPFAAILPLSLIYWSVKRKLALTASSTGENASGLPVRVAFRECMVLLPVTYSLAFLMGMFLETPLSFLGVGVPPPEPALGSMISDGRESLASSWWISLLPLGVVALSVGAFLGIVLPIRRVQKSTELLGPLDTQRIPTAAREGETMTFCTQCGTQLRIGSSFCSQCGTQIA